MKNGYISKCINGELRVGDEVLHLPVDDYPIMRGRVTEIYPVGSKEATETTGNPGDCIHVDYSTGVWTDTRIAEIEEFFPIYTTGIGLLTKSLLMTLSIRRTACSE